MGKARFTNRWEFGALIDGSGVFKTMGRCMLSWERVGVSHGVKVGARALKTLTVDMEGVF